MPLRWSKAQVNLAYATVSFALSFAAWGLISAFAGSFRTQFNLSPQSTALLVAVPVLLGAVARLPLGMLTDRFGGRLVFPLLFFAIAAAAAAVPAATSFEQLLVFAFFLGVAGAAFAVGVGFASRWFPPASQGPGRPSGSHPRARARTPRLRPLAPRLT